MHDESKLTSFMALRGNGWSLARISRELNVPKSTLWHWDNSKQDEIHLLKHYQLERLQDQFLPSYEEELSQLRAYLMRIETALADHDFARMSPQFLLHMSLQLRGRLGKMRQEVPLRNVPFNTPLQPLPYTGCVTRQDATDFRREYSGSDSAHPAAPPTRRTRRMSFHFRLRPLRPIQARPPRKMVRFRTKRAGGGEPATLNTNSLRGQLSGDRTILS